MSIKTLYSIFKKHPLICTDSRNIINESIFFALKGDSFNGNKYAIQALNKGCSYAIIDEEEHNTHPKMILVDDVLSTLQELAKHHRKQLNIPVIGITGTNGKTTSKELIATVVESQYKIIATKGNLNNHIGVPLSILRLKKDTEIAIIEMGANHPEEIDFLCKIALPNFGVITNIGKAHLEGFKDIDGVIKTKNELYTYIKENKGTLFVNSDDKLLSELAEQATTITYGKEGKAKGTVLSNTPFITIKYKEENIKSKLIGNYQFSNIMLAISIGEYFNIPLRKIKKQIEEYTPSNNRSQIIKTLNNTLILDAYNANPSSMKAMLTSFSEQNYENKMCILGDMLELGKDSEKEHKLIVDLTNNLKLDCLFVGEEFKAISKNCFKHKNELINFIKEGNPIINKTILLKGSRGIGLEELTIVL